MVCVQVYVLVTWLNLARTTEESFKMACDGRLVQSTGKRNQVLIGVHMGTTCKYVWTICAWQ